MKPVCSSRAYFRFNFSYKGFEVQDGGSQQIAPLLQVEAGMRIIDACAGAGGKSLHLAALMKNKGQIHAMDVDERKLHELQRRAKQQGVGIIDGQVISGTALRSLDGWADRLLLDVPCSGTGVIKRKPDTKWKLKPKYWTTFCRPNPRSLTPTAACFAQAD